MFFSILRAPFVVLGAYAAGVLAIPAVSDATHDLSATYDLTRSGAGDYSIKLSNLPTHVDTGGIPKDFHPNVEDIANIKLPRDLATSDHQKEFGFRGCSTSQKGDILEAIDASRRYIANADGYLRTYGSGGPLYKHWFGGRNKAHFTTVRRVFKKLKSYSLVGYIADCTCTDPLPYLRLVSDHKLIRLCTGFWDYHPDGVDQSQAMFLTAALSLFKRYGGLHLMAEGWGQSERLALRHPERAISNLDSYMDFIVMVNGLTLSDWD